MVGRSALSYEEVWNTFDPNKDFMVVTQWWHMVCLLQSDLFAGMTKSLMGW